MMRGYSLQPSELYRLPGLFLLTLLLVLWTGGDLAWSLPRDGRVVSVFDGDTVLLDTGEKVRYLGIDAPEVTHGKDPADCFGSEAKRANSDWVFGKRVSLRYDKETRDAYGRLLAYVLLPDGRCVNAELLRSGYAFLYRTPEGFERLGDFLAAQREALRVQAGMWGACSVRPELYYLGNTRSFILHRPRCAMGRQIAKKNLVRFQTRWSGLEEGYRPCRLCKP